MWLLFCFCCQTPIEDIKPADQKNSLLQQLLSSDWWRSHCRLPHVAISIDTHTHTDIYLLRGSMVLSFTINYSVSYFDAATRRCYAPVDSDVDFPELTYPPSLPRTSRWNILLLKDSIYGHIPPLLLVLYYGSDLWIPQGVRAVMVISEEDFVNVCTYSIAFSYWETYMKEISQLLAEYLWPKCRSLDILHTVCDNPSVNEWQVLPRV